MSTYRNFSSPLSTTTGIGFSFSSAAVDIYKISSDFLSVLNNGNYIREDTGNKFVADMTKDYYGVIAGYDAPIRIFTRDDINNGTATLIKLSSEPI